ncbi:MAG: hypothetical protein LBN74_06310, partial [Prevotella sp.]|nr:hypothetical protein [Prevotella sp.]
MFDSDVLKIYRDFSCILIPSSLLAAGAGGKKPEFERALLNSNYDINTHPVGCDCPACCDIPISEVYYKENKKPTNLSEFGYLISSRSKKAIKNAANSIFFRSEHKEYLRFITFTFPPLPESFSDKVQEDKYLHKLFLKFIDNERKHYGLNKWLWTNERQSGERLEEHEKGSREVLHYHCIFEYENRINYYMVNLRFLRLLYRNNFNILSSYSKSFKKNSLGYTRLKSACQAIAKG